MLVKFIKKELIAKDVFSFYFKPEKKLRYVAGQFIELTLPHPHADARGIKRWFSLSSSPKEELLSITTKMSDPGSTYKKFLSELLPGSTARMSQPMGDFVLPKDSSLPLIFVAGGIGNTPFRSMIVELQLKQEKRKIKLLYITKDPKEVAFRDNFEKLGSDFEIMVRASVTPESTKQVTEKINDYYINQGQPYVYLSGPEPMVESLEKNLKAAGVKKRHLYTDFFLGYPAQ